MKGLAIKELLGIVDFIYYGQANIFQKDINDFLAAADDLQLKGLAHNMRLCLDELHKKYCVKIKLIALG